MKREEIEKVNPNVMITKKKNIKNIFLLNYTDLKIVKEFLYCIISDENDEKYDLVLFTLAEKLELIGNLMYEVKGEMKKLSEQFYKEEIFIGLAETKEEIFRFISNTNGKDEDEIVNVFFNIRDVISKMLASEKHFGNKFEYAYAILYAKQHHGTLPEPVGDFIPENYIDYDYKNYFKI